jgi:pimeloyl-ACP methyl ester carboxylesterase
VFYKDLAPLLAQRYRVIFWDYRAHGRSERAGDGRSYAIADHADDLNCVIEALSERPPCLVSFSMGVQVTVEWARRWEDGAVPGYVFLLGTPRNPLYRHWFWGSPQLRHFLETWLESPAGSVIPHLHPVTKGVLRTRLAYEVALRTELVSPDFSYGDFLEFITYSSGVRPDAYLRCALGALEHNGVDQWQRLESPALYIAGQKDLIVPAAVCRDLSELLPDGRYHETDEASHAGSVEAGPAMARAVIHFLDKCTGQQEDGSSSLDRLLSDVARRRRPAPGRRRPSGSDKT